MNADLNGCTSQENLFVRHILVAAGTATYAGVDLNTYIGEMKAVLVAFSPVADGSTTLTVSFLDSADNTTYAALSTPTFTPITATSGVQSVAIDTRTVRRYLQGKHIVTGTTATFDAALVLIGEKQVM
jgi:hypothetical protein